MKKSMIVMMMIVIVFSMNLFAEVVSEKTEDQISATECNHEKVKEEGEPSSAKPCFTEKKLADDHKCTEKCDEVKNHVCTDECKLDETNKTCELAMLKDHCSNEAKKLGCKPEGCEQKVIKKGCHK